MAKSRKTRKETAIAKEQFAAQIAEWHELDASKIVLGRLATQAAHMLLGKHRPDFAANKVASVFVVVTNSDKLLVTGNKKKQKTYYHFSGYPGGLKHRTLEEQMARDSRKAIEMAVFGMLPKNSLRPQRMKHLKVYAGPGNPHTNTITAE